MESMTALDDCLYLALRDVAPVPAERLPMSDALGAVLAEALHFASDMPPTPQALREGFAVTALDLTGASADVPIALQAPIRLLPADPLPPGRDAVLPPDGVEATQTGWEAIRPVSPGHGVRRAGHDGRADVLIAPAGAWVSARLCLVAELSGLSECSMRRPRVSIALLDPVQAAFARRFLTNLGAQIVNDAPHLVLRPTNSTQQRLALSPAETAWLAREDGALALSVPRRFDGMVAACLALAVPAMAALSMATPLSLARPLTRKVASALGMSDLVLLTRQGERWHPGPAGTLTLAALATADAYAILPPESEGLPAGATLAGISLSSPFGRS
jgi:molybdopterin biosynthesis enzyme